MNRNQACLFVGLGSHCGDDQLGWIVADQLRCRGRSHAVVRKAATPADLLDWLPGKDRLLICDACLSPGASGTILRFDWPNHDLATLRFSGTHDLSLPAVLDLAGKLALLPPHTAIWSMTIRHPADLPCHDDTTSRSYADFGELSPSLTAAIPALVAQIEQELHHA